MKRKFIIAFTLLVLSGGSYGFGQADFSKQVVPALQVEGWGLQDVMHNIAVQTHLAIGVELNVVMSKAGHLKLDFQGGTVTDLAEKCAALMPGVHWKIVNNRSLFMYFPGKATELSELRIQYQGMTQATRQQVWEDLSNHSEIDTWMLKNDCKRQEFWMSEPWQGDGSTISISSGTIALGDLLEAAASQSNNHFWSIVKNTNNGKCVVSIFLW